MVQLNLIPLLLQETVHPVRLYEINLVPFIYKIKKKRIPQTVSLESWAADPAPRYWSAAPPPKAEPIPPEVRWIRIKSTTARHNKIKRVVRKTIMSEDVVTN